MLNSLRILLLLGLAGVSGGCVTIPIHGAQPVALLPDRPPAEVPFDAWPGCYRVDFSWWQEFPGDRLILTAEGGATSTDDSRSFRAGPEVEFYWSPPSWRLVAADLAEISWLQIHHAVVVHLRMAGDSLVGVVGPGTGGGSYWGPSLPRRDFTAYRIDCAAAPGSMPAPSVGRARYEFWSAVGTRVGGPQKAALDIGLLRLPGILALGVEPGLGGGQLGLGPAFVSPYTSARLQGVLLRTWGEPWLTEPNRWYAGVDLRMAVGVGLGLSVYRHVGGPEPRRRWLLAPQLVFGF